MSTDSAERLQQRIDDLEQQVARLESGIGRRGVRMRSGTSVMGLPLVDIAMGPDPVLGERRGHARGIIAVGDIATGVLALGGVARGVVAIGGVALGGVALGGCSVGVLAGLGGLAIGAVALGGLAIGLVAAGGGAIGYYAAGGAAFGKYVISGFEQHPQAVEFFKSWLPYQ